MCVVMQGRGLTQDAIAGVGRKGAQVGESRSGLVAAGQPDQTNVICCKLRDAAHRHTHILGCHGHVAWE